MGNVLSMKDDEIEKRMKEMGGTDEQIAAAKILLRNEGLRNIFSKYSEEMENFKEESSKKAEEFLNSLPTTYQGYCGFSVKDPEGQKILDKYLPRDLNSHASDMLNLFCTTTFKQLRESSDRYPENAF